MKSLDLQDLIQRSNMNVLGLHLSKELPEWTQCHWDKLHIHKLFHKFNHPLWGKVHRDLQFSLDNLVLQVHQLGQLSQIHGGNQQMLVALCGRRCKLRKSQFSDACPLLEIQWICTMTKKRCLLKDGPKKLRAPEVWSKKNELIIKLRSGASKVHVIGVLKMIWMTLF